MTSPDELNDEIVQKALSDPPNKSGNKLDQLSATVPARLLGILLDPHQRLASWLAKEVSNPRTGCDTSTQK